MSETDTMRRIITNCSRGDIRLWRNNVGVGYMKDGTPLRFGLTPGSSDLIGLRSVVIIPELVGQRLAQFVACEVKTPRGTATEEQRNFLMLIMRMGGLAFIARSFEDAQEELR